MARARSPEYPAMGLKEAVERVKLVYEKDYQNKIPKAVIAVHMGYKGLNGTSLPAIAALSKYELLEGRGDETRVSDLALAIIAHAPGTPERIEAVRTAATKPELFAELAEKFPHRKSSDQAIRSYLLTQRFIPAAADIAIRTYRETMQLVEDESAGYSGSETISETPMQTAISSTQMPKVAVIGTGGTGAKVLQEVFNLPEGVVTLTLPNSLSSESFQDLQDQMSITLRRLKRMREAQEDFEPVDISADLNQAR